MEITHLEVYEVHYPVEDYVRYIDISRICNILSYYDKIDHKNKISINLTDGSSISLDQSEDEFKDFLKKDMECCQMLINVDFISLIFSRQRKVYKNELRRKKTSIFGY